MITSFLPLSRLSLAFYSSIIICPGVGFLGLSYLEFSEFLGYLYSRILSNLGIFQSLLFHFISAPFFFSFWDSHSVYVSVLDDIQLATVPLGFLYFTFFSFPFCSLDSIISIVLCSVFQIFSSAYSNSSCITVVNF